jgi:transposase
MGRNVLTVKGYSSDQIKALFRKDERYTMGMRLYAVYQVSLGKSSRSLEQLYNTSFKQITNWVHQFEKEGLEGLKDKEGRGRKSRLTEDQREKLRSVLVNETPMNYGYNTETWTGPLVGQYLKNEFGIAYRKAQVYNILKSIGLTYQKGRGTYPESDEVAREMFKEALKKTNRKS